MIYNVRKLLLGIFRVFFIILLLYGVNAYAATQDPKIKIGDKIYPLSLLKKQFKTYKVVVAHNPAYGSAKKVYDAFNLNQILSKLLAVDFTKVNKDQVLIVDTLDHYLSQIPLKNFTTEGQAYLAYREASNTIAEQYRTEDNLWSYISKYEKKVNPGPFYIVWDNTKTYPTGWPYQVISMHVVNKNHLVLYEILNPVNQSTSVKKGQALFIANCSPCHSLYYQGAQGRAPDLGMVTNYLAPDNITNLIRNGRGGMPPIGKNFSQEEIESIISYLQWVSHQSSRIKIEIQ